MDKGNMAINADDNLKIAENDAVLAMSREELIESHNKLREYIFQLTALSRQKEKLYVELQTLYIGAISALINTVEAKHSSTQNHSLKVAKYSKRIAETMGLDNSIVKLVEKSALLHDIGKIGISDLILQKIGPLSDSEFSNIKIHADRGVEILKQIKFLTDALPAIRHHHERYDGHGYPSGLKGVEIPFMARIIALADTYDAITSDRPYRKRKSHSEAVEELRRCAGTQFDPVITETVVKNAPDIFLADSDNEAAASASG